MTPGDFLKTIPGEMKWAKILVTLHDLSWLHQWDEMEWNGMEWDGMRWDELG
jgi:hypothetical protein